MHVSKTSMARHDEKNITSMYLTHPWRIKNHLQDCNDFDQSHPEELLFDGGNETALMQTYVNLSSPDVTLFSVISAPARDPQTERIIHCNCQCLYVATLRNQLQQPLVHRGCATALCGYRQQ